MKQAQILDRLPDVFKEGATPDNPLFALVGVMEELHARDEDILTGFGAYLDPRRTTDPFVPYLAGGSISPGSSSIRPTTGTRSPARRFRAASVRCASSSPRRPRRPSGAERRRASSGCSRPPPASRGTRSTRT